MSPDTVYPLLATLGAVGVFLLLLAWKDRNP